MFVPCLVDGGSIQSTFADLKWFPAYKQGQVTGSWDLDSAKGRDLPLGQWLSQLSAYLYAPEGLECVQHVDDTLTPDSYMFMDKQSGAYQFTHNLICFSEYTLTDLDMNSPANFPDLVIGTCISNHGSDTKGSVHG